MNQFRLVKTADSLSWSVVLRIVECVDARTDSRVESGTKSRTLYLLPHAFAVGSFMTVNVLMRVRKSLVTRGFAFCVKCV